MSSPEPLPDRRAAAVSEATDGTPGTVDPADAAGPSATSAELRRFGRRYPAVGRAAVAVLSALTVPFTAPPGGFSTGIVVAAGVIAWNLAYLALVLPDGKPPEDPRRRVGVACAVDLVLVCGLCLAKPVLVDPQSQLDSLGWVSPIASFTVVAVQFQLRTWAAAAGTLAVCLAFVAGTAASPGLTAVDGLLVGGGWMAVEAALAHLLWRLLLRGGREADRQLGARFAAERAAATAAARRHDQRAHWATVHDTSATTLLMVGLGEVSGAEEWLPGQIGRDIDLLGGRLEVDAGEVDVGTALRVAAERVHLHVELDCPAGVTAPGAVASAVAGATAEALENVRRHAGTGSAAVVLRRTADGVEVLVVDAGRGFDPAGVGPHRLGLAWSVHDRMESVGGCAAVESAPSDGTAVRLWWPA